LSQVPQVAYFSMEIGLDSAIPTYAGGLGILAGDTLRSAADLGIPMVAVTLAHRAGYFHQEIDGGIQRETPDPWPLEEHVELLPQRVSLELEGRLVEIRGWRYLVRGVGGGTVPVYLLDTDCAENAAEDRKLTDSLYGGDDARRLSQEAVLGIGGVRFLRALGHESIERFHLNEGHAALSVLAILEEGASPILSEEALASVRGRCVFTTHTPVSAGHDRFSGSLVSYILGDRRSRDLRALLGKTDLNMTDLALAGSRFVNGVAMRHGEVSREMFQDHPIRSITNGVHLATWAAPSFQRLYDESLPDWRHDALSLRYAIGLPKEAIWAAHAEAKGALLRAVAARSGVALEADVLTLGFARRSTAYKRPTLVFRDLERLRAIVRNTGRLQLIFAGKAHPRDSDGKDKIRAIHRAAEALAGTLSVVFLPDYDMELGALLCSGCDVWLNNPLPPLEASGTSGMKAAVNGVPSLSVLDGWWVEGYVPGVTGWAIGDGSPDARPPTNDASTAAALYDALETSVIPCFYERREQFVEMMRYAIALNASFFNTERMVRQYANDAYRLSHQPPS
jgi:starch phosphorylase